MTPSDTLDAVVGDPAALRRLLRFGGWKLLDAITAMFREQAPAKIATLRAAVRAGDAPAVELNAHSLKSSSAQIGAPLLQGLCQELEAHARVGSLEGAAERVEALDEELAAFVAWLDETRPTLERA